ncbi:hypothetical protein SPRG_19099 [Saprolegnia parasitica CBS 223.65]|uniref:Uncharacterized protein n=1 Tax=Saprolegnia parasitica (strain CBS 223.65) TaxID=695850 RepID=A0A067D6I5_SAPPC|nr:hypothetical protein SPRG_19099 [Saprolegnia parasitica CBS 223.65]KDO34281.1 hypothetical protein SPRG_19099 [Saprolegnia parasitica CBS 223.65]|eukprot:XP_012195294.1 hypothetical protein SPRG_19099 [Saprolegnia parasitica CBS 223.65]
MALDLELRRALAEINKELDGPPPPPTAAPRTIVQASTLLAKLQQWTSLGNVAEDQLRLTELLPCIAEVALKQSDVGTSEACVEWYLTLAYPKDQFYCRALLVRAAYLGAKARALTGQSCVGQVQYAIHWILVALKLALEPSSRPHYDFLVYNASVAYWHVARPLLRPRTSKYLIESLVALLDGLKSINDANKAWLIRFELTLAAAYDDDKQLAKAGAVALEASEHALALMQLSKNAPANVLLFEEACFLQIHLGRYKDPECAKGLAAAKKAMTTRRGQILYAIQAIKSKIVLPEALPAAFAELFELVTKTKLEAYLHKPIDAFPALQDGSVDWDNLVEVGLLGVFQHQLEVARIVEHLVHENKRVSARARIVVDVLRCFVHLLEKADAATLDARQREAARLSHHVEGVKLLERSLTAAKRVGDAHLMQDICIYAWNVALPLLEPHLRKHVHRLFTAATALLEELDSPLVTLRAQMHLETAKCEMQCDYLAKASVHVNKALVLDYGEVASSDESAHPSAKAKAPSASVEVVRAFDKYLLPMKRVLDLKSNLYGEPDAIEDQALIYVEQSKESHDKHLKLTWLNKAVTLLDASAPESPSTLEKDIFKKRFALWYDIATLAWDVKAIETTRRGAGRAHKYVFALVDLEAVQQARLHFVLAETYTLEMQKLKQEHPSLDGRLGLLVKAGDAPDDILSAWNECKGHVIEEILKGLQRGLDTKATHVIHNAAAYLWNYHYGLFGHSELDLDLVLPELITAMEKAFHALLGLEGIAYHLPLLASVAQGLTRLYAGKLNDIEAVVDAVLKISGLAILQRKALIEIKTRVQLDRGGKEPIVGDNVPMKVVSCLTLLDALQNERRGDDVDVKGQMDKTLGLFQKATGLWTPFAADHLAAKESCLELDQQKREFHAEVWVRLAKTAVFLERSHEAQKFCELALAPLAASDIPSGLLIPAIWRWYALAQTVWAQAILDLASGTETQERDIKHELALFAVQHLLLAAEFGVRAGNPRLVERAAMVMWNGVLDILDANASPNVTFRRKLLPDLQRMLSHLEAAGAASDWASASKLHLWEPGLDAVEAAFASIPAYYQRPLWQYRVIFMSKLGKSVQDGFAKMKDNDVLLQARVAKRVAASSTDAAAQYKALFRTVKDLAGMPEQAQFQLEIAEWLYTNQFPLDDVHDQIHTALSLVLPLIWKDALPTNEKGATKRVKAKKKKDESVVLQWWHLDVALRGYVMLATAAHSFAERLEYVLAGLGHVLKMWHVLCDELHLLELQAAFESYSQQQTGDKLETDFEVWRGQSSLAPSLALPISTTEWVKLDTTPHLPRLCGETPAAKHSPLTLHPENVTHPTLTLHYLLQLIEMAVGHCLHSHALPCLHLAHAIAYGTRASASSSLGDVALLPILLDLRLASLLEAMAYIEPSQVYLKRAIEALRGQPGAPTSEKALAHSATSDLLRRRKLLFSKYSVVDLGLEMVELLLQSGFHLQVKQLLAALPTNDEPSGAAWADYCAGQLHAREGDHAMALRHFTSAVGTPHLDVQAYTKYVLALASLYAKMKRIKDAKDLVAAGRHAVAQLQLIPLSPVARAVVGDDKTHLMDLDSITCLSQLEAMYATVLVQESQSLFATGGEWQPIWAEATRLFSESSSRLLPLGGNLVMADTLSAYGVLLRERSGSWNLIDTDVSLLDAARSQLLSAHAYIESLWALASHEPVLQTRLAQIKYELGCVDVVASMVHDETHMVVYQVESDAKKNLVELWLAHTAPKTPKTAEEMCVPPAQKALLYFSTSLQLDPAHCLSAAGVGQCLRLHLPPTYEAWVYGQDTLRKQGIACSTGTPALATEAKVDDVARYLTQLLATAVKAQHRRVIQHVCYELLQVYGCQQPLLAAKYLLWFQSCVASAYAESVFYQAAEPTNRPSLFMQRAQQLPATSIPGQLAKLFLESQSETWRRLQVTADIDTVLASLPPNYMLLSLQLSLDGKYLFGSLTGGSATPVVARMELHRPRRLALRELLAKLRAMRVGSVKQLLQYSDLPYGESDEFEYATNDGHDDPLEAMFQSLVEEARTLFGSFLHCFTESFPLKTKDDMLTLLLVDPSLEPIPFEALLEGGDARDLSVHLLAQRYASLKVSPFKRDDLFFIADPRHDDPTEVPPTSIAPTLHAIKTIPSFQWRGLTGQKCVPSVGEWQVALTGRHGGGLLYYGPNRTLAHFSPSHLAGLNATKCNLVWGASRMENYASYRRQSKSDTHKSKEMLSLEDSFNSTVLFSLAGVNSIVSNQWASSFLANHRSVTTTLGLMAKNVPLAKAIRRVGDTWYLAHAPKSQARSTVKSVPLKGRVLYNPIVYGLPTL